MKTSFRTAENPKTKLKKGRRHSASVASTCRPCGIRYDDAATWDANDLPIRTGDTVVRLRDVDQAHYIPDVQRLFAERLTGVVVSVHAPRAHVRWANDQVGTMPYCFRLVKIASGVPA